MYVNFKILFILMTDNSNNDKVSSSIRTKKYVRMRGLYDLKKNSILQ